MSTAMDGAGSLSKASAGGKRAAGGHMRQAWYKGGLEGDLVSGTDNRLLAGGGGDSEVLQSSGGKGSAAPFWELF